MPTRQSVLALICNRRIGIGKQFGKLDLLINNAAIAPTGDGPPSKVNIEAVETAMRTNYLVLVRSYS